MHHKITATTIGVLAIFLSLLTSLGVCQANPLNRFSYSLVSDGTNLTATIHYAQESFEGLDATVYQPRILVLWPQWQNTHLQLDSVELGQAAISADKALALQTTRVTPEDAAWSESRTIIMSASNTNRVAPGEVLVLHFTILQPDPSLLKWRLEETVIAPQEANDYLIAENAAFLAPQLPTLTLGSLSGFTGNTVTIPVRLTNLPGTDLAGFQCDIGFDGNAFDTPMPTIGPAAEGAGKSLAHSYPGAGILRLMVIGMNATTIASGVVAFIEFPIKPAALAGNSPLVLSDYVGSTPEATSVTLAKSDGAIAIHKEKPAVTTQTATDITTTAATGHGTIVTTGGINPTTRGLCWGAAANPTIEGDKSSENGSFTAGAFTVALTGLLPNTTYHVRAYATNPQGTAYGEDLQFTTLSDTTPPDAPMVSGTTPTNNIKPTWSWTSGVSGGNGTFRYKRNNKVMTTGATVTTDTSYTPATKLAQGTQTLYVQERDAAGNWSKSGSFAIVIDTTRPDRPTVTGITPTNSTKPTWTWTPGANAGNGTYRYKRNSNVMATGATETTANSFTPATALKGTHTLYVQERDAAGNWSPSGAMAIVIDPDLKSPAAPTDLVATYSTSVSLSWTDAATNELGYSIFRKLHPDGEYSKIADIAPNLGAYEDTTAVANATYTYYVAAGNGAGATNSAPVTITTGEIEAPDQVRAKVTATGLKVNLTWRDNSGSEDHALVRRIREGEGMPTAVAALGPDTVAFSDTGLTPRILYTYSICATGQGGAEECSNPITVNGPTAIKATKDATGVNLTWTDNSDDETGFRVFRRKSTEVTTTQIDSDLTADTTAFTDTTTEMDTTYLYAVEAFTSVGSATTPTEARITTGTVIPPGTFMAAVTPGGTEATLTWIDKSTTETGFELWRRAQGEPEWGLVSSMAPNTMAALDPGLAPGLLYTYQVCAIAPSGGRSCSLTRGVNGPSDLLASLQTGTDVTLTWQDNASDETGFIIYRRKSTATTHSAIATLLEESTTFTDTATVAGTTYYYQVCANNSATASCSDVVEIVVP